MRGHLQQRGADSWRLKVFLGRSTDGKKRYLERTVRGTRSEADQELARLVVEAGEGRWTPSAPMTMAELLDRWLKLKATTVESSTVSNYEWIARRYVVPAFGDRKVASIRTMELDEFYARLRLSGGVESRPLSGRTVRICHTVMRQSLDRPASGASSPATRRGTPLPVGRPLRGVSALGRPSPRPARRRLRRGARLRRLPLAARHHRLPAGRGLRAPVAARPLTNSSDPATLSPSVFAGDSLFPVAATAQQLGIAVVDVWSALAVSSESF